jgi:hypothetical protein
MDYIPYFKDLVFPETNERIIDWEYMEVSQDIRIYFHNKSSTCDFYVVNFVSCSGGVLDFWKDSDLKVECLFHGYIYYDGLRHLYMGDEDTDTENYLYYVDSSTIVDIFSKLKELENDVSESCKN